jgi:hypothetical protein
MGIQQILLGAVGGDAWEEAGITATGGTMHTNQENPDGTPYTWHVFPGGPRGPNTNLTYDFDVTAVSGPGKFEYIMMAGGGVGGISPNPDPSNPGDYRGAGGGGAGGVICNFESPPAIDTTTYHPFYPSSPGAQTASVQAYPISVGRAGAGNPPGDRKGKDTSFLGLTAIGGGWGAHANGPAGPAGSGGSGGGGGSPPGQTAGASGTPGQGKAGGDGENASAGGGGGASTGGGGASGAGGQGVLFDDASYFRLGNYLGGIADDPANPGHRYLAGGGGGGGPTGSGFPPGVGGFGGGGDAGNPNGNGGNADNWSGGGGGGGGGGDQTRFAGHGGQGMVFIRYVAN